MKHPANLSNRALLARIVTLTERGDALEAQLIEHLAEVIARNLHEQLGLRSVFSYVTSVLGFSRDVAHRRIRAARAVLCKPEALEQLKNGRLTVSSLDALAPAIHLPNALEQALGKSKRDVANMVALMRGKPSPRSNPKPPTEASGGATTLTLSLTLREKIAKVARLRAQVGADETTAKDLSTPNVIECALDGLIAALEDSLGERFNGASEATRHSTETKREPKGVAGVASRAQSTQAGVLTPSPHNRPGVARVAPATTGQAASAPINRMDQPLMSRRAPSGLSLSGESRVSTVDSPNTRAPYTRSDDRRSDRGVKRRPILPLVAAWIARGLRETGNGVANTTEATKRRAGLAGEP